MSLCVRNFVCKNLYVVMMCVRNYHRFVCSQLRTAVIVFDVSPSCGIRSDCGLCCRLVGDGFSGDAACSGIRQYSYNLY